MQPKLITVLIVRIYALTVIEVKVRPHLVLLVDLMDPISENKFSGETRKCWSATLESVCIFTKGRGPNSFF